MFLKIVSQSDTESGVQFDLALTVQKLAYRRVRMSFLCAACPMVESLMDFPIITYILIWQRNGTIVPYHRHYVHVLKGRGHG